LGCQQFNYFCVAQSTYSQTDMSQLIFRVVLIFAIFILIDIYTFQAIKTAFRNHGFANFFYWGLTLLVLLYMMYALTTFDRAAGPNKVVNVFMGLMVLTYVPKLFVVIFLFSEDIIRVLQGSITWLADFINFNEGNPNRSTYIPSRRAFVSKAGLMLAAIPLTSIFYGMWKGKYNYRVIKQTLFFDDLPADFDGFTLAHISDIHSGSFDDTNKIAYGIDLLNDQNPDVVLFTGDLVNNKAEEMEPWIETFARIKSKHGKFSVLGNHDYGDYITWDSAQHKDANMHRLQQIHQELGFDLLNNRNQRIEKNGSHINILGVENWGLPPFPQRGDLKKATQNVEEKSFNILLSHDPSHFDAEVKSHDKKIHLTLSGHTHGMQFGIEIPGIIKWSPVKYRYPKWAGLYEEFGRYLYVNRGFGFLAFPGRVGIWPEITLIELRKS
jgi:predicted MPP superfamily phosphohydrolase